MTKVQVNAPCGALRGAEQSGVVSFRGVPYAQAPLGELRFAAPQPLPRWPGVRDATADGPVPPQGKSRLAAVTGGEVERAQSEDCLTLTVTGRAGGGVDRPVMVWVHGGGFVGGAGSMPWYAGDDLVGRGDVLLVAINYRQGALGHLYLPAVSPGNLALLDIVAALGWVKDNISAFGGAADNITLFGQSSGGVAINALLAMPTAEGLFHRAVIQSAPLGRPVRSAVEAAQIGERFASALGVASDDSDAFKKADVGAILAAQGEHARSLTPLALGYGEQAFGPVVDGKVLLPAEEAWGHARGAGVHLVIGTNREEQAAQFFVDPGVQQASGEQAANVIRHFAGESADTLITHYVNKRPVLPPAQLLCDFYTDMIFRLPSIGLAERRTKAGLNSWVYEFDWQSPAGFGACHCLELAFVFGSLDRFADAPMLRGVDVEGFRDLSERMQDAWLRFAERGDPNPDSLANWPAYDTAARATMKFDSRVEAVEDLAGVATHPMRQALGN